MTKSVTVLDYGSGNVHSVCKALTEAGANVTLTDNASNIYESDGLVVPGVGAFGSVMEKLKAHGADRLIDKRLTASRPVLGICVGMQVMFETGLEHGLEAQGLGQWPGTVKLLDASRLPHIGWSKVEASSGPTLFYGVGQECFYVSCTHFLAHETVLELAWRPVIIQLTI